MMHLDFNLLKKQVSRLSKWTAVLLVLGFANTIAANSLDSIDYSSLPGGKLKITLQLAEPLSSEISSFATDNPARIAIDLQGVTNGLAQKTTTIGVGNARSITAVEAGDKTRVVLNLLSSSDFSIDTAANNVVITMEGGSGASSMAGITKTEARGISAATQLNDISGIDFKRGDNGKAEIILLMEDTNAVVDMRTEGTKLVLDIIDASISPELARKLDVGDFATPVKTIETFTKGNNVRIVIQAEGDYEHLAYQLDDSYVLEVRPLSKEEVEEIALQKKVFTGDRLSLNFQSIEVRSVLQLLADFTGLNIVVSDSVGGSVTLRLMNVPWDQALDIILRTKGLAMRQNENVMLVAPAAEIDAWEQRELEALQKKEDLSPLRTELIEVNYATASEIAAILEQDRGTDENDKSSLLSSRGTVTVDTRTNSLLIKDTSQKIEEVRKLLLKLDVPIKQVMIESRIVEANSDWSRELGVRLGIWDEGRQTTAIGADPTNSDTNRSKTLTAWGLAEAFGANLAGGGVGNLGLVLARAGSTVIDLELRAMEAESKGEIMSNPRILTSNNTAATIQQGTKVAVPGESESGGTTTEYVDATLSLTVTPQITPDDKIIMDLQVNNDDLVGTATDDISTKSVTTQVVVNNGDTVILGGVFKQTKTLSEEKVPFLGDLPVMGVLFRNKLQIDDNSELLIFITPKIVKDSIKQN